MASLRSIMSVFLVVCLTSLAFSQGPKSPTNPDPRMVFLTNNGGQYIGCTSGSAVSIAGEQYIASCSHDTHGLRDKLTVQFADGKVGSCQTVAVTRNGDTSLYKITAGRAPATFKIADQAPAMRSIVTLRGFPD